MNEASGTTFESYEGTGANCPGVAETFERWATKIEAFVAASKEQYADDAERIGWLMELELYAGRIHTFARRLQASGKIRPNDLSQAQRQSIYALVRDAPTNVRPPLLIDSVVAADGRTVDLGLSMVVLMHGEDPHWDAEVLSHFIGQLATIYQRMLLQQTIHNLHGERHESPRS